MTSHLVWIRREIKHVLKLKVINDGLVCNKHAVFASEDVHLLTEVVLIMDYCDVFISCLDSNSGGTHSQQRIHCWVSKWCIYIYIYAFSRRFYPKRLTLHSSYSFYILSALAFPGNRTHDLGVASAMLYQLSYRKADAMLNVSKSILNQNDLLGGGLCEDGALVDWERLFPCFYIKTFFFFCNLIIYTPLVCVNEVNNLVWALSQARSDEDMSLLLRQKISVLSFHAVSSVFCKSLTVKPWGEKRVTMHKTPQEKNYRHVYEVNNRVWVYIPVGVHV